MRSIDLLCPCETTSDSVDLDESTNATFVESINATLKEVADSINASNAEIKDDTSLTVIACSPIDSLAV